MVMLLHLLWMTYVTIEQEGQIVDCELLLHES
jgi:hypothetical protein